MSRLYGPNNQVITIPSLKGLADDGEAVSDAIDNSSNIFRDALVRVQIKTVASVDGDGTVLVGAVGSNDEGVTYASTANQFLRILGIFTANVDGTVFISNLISIANGFNSQLPEFWKLVIKNQTGQALDNTDNPITYAAAYQGINRNPV